MVVVIADPGIWPLLWGTERHVHEVHLMGEDGPVCCWIPCHHRERLLRLLDAPDCWISAVPRNRRDAMCWDETHHLWVHLTKPDSATRLARFITAPTFVWRDGRSSRRWASWALTRPLTGAWVQRATERLSYALGGVRRTAAPSTLMPSPFTRRWYIEFQTPATYTARQIVGHLKDAPDPNAWKAAA